MKRTSILSLVAVAAVAALAGWLVLTLLERLGYMVPISPWFTLVFLVAVGGWLVWKGRAVRKLAAGERTSMTSLGAAQVLGAAKASAVTGSILTGISGSLLVTYAPRWASPFGQNMVVSAAMVAVASLALVVVALIVERWCEIPPDDDAPSTAQTAGA